MSRKEVPRAGLLKAALAGKISNAQGRGIETRLLVPWVTTPTPSRRQSSNSGSNNREAGPRCSISVVARARNPLQADRPLEFRFEIVI